MMKLFRAALFLAWPGLAALAAEAPAAGTGVSFSRAVAPIFQKKCVSCHGPEKARGKYRLHTYADMMKPGDSKSSPVTAGQPAQSELFRRLTARDEEDRMPQKDDPLPAAQLALLERWIIEGARFGDLIRMPDARNWITYFQMFLSQNQNKAMRQLQ